MKILISAVAVLFSLILGGSSYGESYQFLSQWGDVRPDLSTQLNKPRGVAVDSESNVYVSETYSNRILKYDSNGTIIWTKTECNGSPVSYPMGIGVDGNDNIYVVEMLADRVCVVDKFGNWIRTITGNFNRPLGVSIDDNFNVYVTDRKNNVVKKVDGSGTVIATWNGFTAPWDLVIHGGYVFVTDLEKAGFMIKKMTMDGVLIKQWGPSGIGEGQFKMAQGIAAFNNRLYVSDGEYGRLQIFDTEGNFVALIGGRGTGNGQLQFPSAVAIDEKNGWLYVSDDDNDRIVKLDLSGNFIAQWGCDSSGATGLRYPTKIAVDSKNEYLYIVDSGNHRIIKTTLDFQVLSSWGGYGLSDGLFRYPIDASIDSAGNVYVLDNARRNVQKFTPEGIFLYGFDINFDLNKYLYGLQDIFVDSLDTVCVVDADTEKLYKLTTGGTFLDRWNIPYYSTGMTIDELAGTTFITTFRGDLIEKRDSFGEVTAKMGIGIFFHPWDVALAEKGNLLVTDTFQHKLVKLDPLGNIITEWGSTGGIMNPGTEPGKFAYPYGVAVDKYGYVYVADTNNHRIQKFARVIFNDTPADYWALPFIDAVFDANITAGCGSSNYCPDNSVTRAQMAVFILKSLEIAPADSCSESVFSDVNETVMSDEFCKYIEKFATLGITAGCGDGTTYCPDLPVSRDQMAVFITKALGETASTCSGQFADVDGTTGGNEAFCRYIEKFATLGITAGCGNGNYCPSDEVSRAQMAVFLTKAFLP